MDPFQEIIETEIHGVAVLEGLGEVRLPPDSIVQRHPLSRLPGIGSVCAEIPLVLVALILPCLVEHSHAADKEIGHAKSRHRTVECGAARVSALVVVVICEASAAHAERNLVDSPCPAHIVVAAEKIACGRTSLCGAADPEAAGNREERAFGIRADCR